MFCRKCGNEIDEGERFCTKCGVPTDDAYTEEFIENQKPLSAAIALDSDATTTPDATASAFDAADTGTPMANVEDDVAGVDGDDGKKSGRRGVKIALVVVICAIVVIAVIISALLLSSRISGSDTVYFGSNERTYVRPHTDIVLYDESGEPLSDYDITLSDADGNMRNEHVQGDSFSFDDFGIDDGDYTLSIGGEDVGLDVGVVSDGQDAPDGSEVHEDEIDVMFDDNNDSNEVKEPTAYDLYYQKVLELQAEYGEGKVVDEEDSYHTYVDGLAVVQLIDFNKDDTEELVAVYYDDSKSPYGTDPYATEDGVYPFDCYTTKIWTYNNSKHDLDEVYEGALGNDGEGFDAELEVSISAERKSASDDIETNDETIWDVSVPYIRSYSQTGGNGSWSTEHYTYFGEMEDGRLDTIVFEIEHSWDLNNNRENPDVYKINGQDTDFETYTNQEAKYSDESHTKVYEVYRYDPWKLNDKYDSYSNNDRLSSGFYDENKTLSITQDTIQTLAEGADISSDDHNAMLGASASSNDASDDLFSEIAGKEFVFSSGAGAWRSAFTINSDGTFSGKYYDSDMGDTGPGYPNGTAYETNFEGKFSNADKVGDYEYSLKLDVLSIESEPGEGDETIKNGVRIKNIKDDVCGFGSPVEAPNHDYRLLLPGYDTNALTDEQTLVLLSFGGGVYEMPNPLDTYILTNVDEAQPTTAYWMEQ